MRQIPTLLALAVIVAGYQANPSEPTNLELTKLVVDKNLRAGQRYNIALQFRMTGSPSVKRVCLLWSGEGPYCLRRIYTNKVSGEILTWARTDNPGMYRLTGYVEYQSGTEMKHSNRVSATIIVD